MKHHETDEAARLKSLFWHLVDRLDSCCTTACGREDDVMHSPPVKEIHYSTRLESLHSEQDVTRFVWSGSFPNDGTFPVSDEELLDARYHSLDEESEVSSVVRKIHSNSLRRNGSSSGRGVLQEYFEQCAGEKKSDGSHRRKERHRGPKCHVSVSYAPQQQVPGLASGRG